MCFAIARSDPSGHKKKQTTQLMSGSGGGYGTANVGRLLGLPKATANTDTAWRPGKQTIRPRPGAGATTNYQDRMNSSNDKGLDVHGASNNTLTIAFNFKWASIGGSRRHHFKDPSR